MAAPVTRSCGCTGEHLCPTAANLRRRALDLAWAEEVEQMAPAIMGSGTAMAARAYRKAVSDFRQHVGGGCKR